MKLRFSFISSRPAFLGCFLAAWLSFCVIPRCWADDVKVPGPILSFAEITPGEILQETQNPSAMSGTGLFASEEQLVDFYASLQLAETQNPNIGLSRQAIQEALAQQLQARSMLLPSARIGGDYRSHWGVLQTSSGKMIDVDSTLSTWETEP